MNSLNKTISLVIGLITIVVFFAVLTGRINLGTKLSRTNKTTITPTPTSKSVLTTGKTPTPTLAYKVNRYQAQTGTTSTNVTSIPATGIPTPLISAFFAALLGGFYLRGKK